ncbi:MAG: type II secretion system protein [Planctomycetota bacterium]
MPRAAGRAFTLTELLVLLGIMAVLLAAIVPVLFAGRHHARLRHNETQVRGIHQSFLVWTSSSKRGGLGEGPYYPGLEWRAGQPTPNGDMTGFSGDGTHPAGRFAALLQGNFFTPDYLINPVDQIKVPVVYDWDTAGDTDYATLTNDNYSYAVLALPGSENERQEWRETLNPQAVVLGDRARGTDARDISSLWSSEAGGEWRGHVGRNDNSVSWSESHVFNDTQYGSGEVNPLDDLFADDPDADDAFLVHEDAVTAYSAN